MRLSSFSLVVLVTLLSCSMAGEWDVYQTFYSRMMNTEGETYSFIVNAIFAGAKSMVGEYLLPSHRELYTCLMDLGRFREAYNKKELWAMKKHRLVFWE
ncbi:hypothetical protein LSTR_LSTR008032 [Laodelphax striatellus]|uniref:Cathepsin propeptide inhibitor domain-containing protein n=1 Tax=Laodelphax striatellus TaxID=195883 RepID=A0A482WJW9_LAOST|nr:hypothetical protein LSTR_LSTR008032 [Laodelphax striatellus]